MDSKKLMGIRNLQTLTNCYMLFKALFGVIIRQREIRLVQTTLFVSTLNSILKPKKGRFLLITKVYVYTYVGYIFFFFWPVHYESNYVTYFLTRDKQ